MRKRSLVMGALMVFTVMTSTRVAQAQDSLVVKVPFDFVAGTASMPAGEYTLKTSGPMSTLLLINRTDPAASVLVPSNSAASSEAQKESKLVFARYGDRYFLSQVWTTGSARGRQLPRSAREKESALTAKNQQPSQVVLVANLIK